MSTTTFISNSKILQEHVHHNLDWQMVKYITVEIQWMEGIQEILCLPTLAILVINNLDQPKEAVELVEGGMVVLTGEGSVNVCICIQHNCATLQTIDYISLIHSYLINHKQGI